MEGTCMSENDVFFYEKLNRALGRSCLWACGLSLAACLLLFAVAAQAQFINPVLTPGNIIVGDPRAFSNAGAVFHLDVTTKTQTVLSTGGSFVDPTGLAVDPTGATFVADYSAFGGSGGVIKHPLSPAPDDRSRVTTSPRGLFVDPCCPALHHTCQLIVSHFVLP